MTSKSPSDEAAVAKAGTKLWHRLAEYFLHEDYGEMDMYAFTEIAVEAGLLKWVEYDPAVHTGESFEECSEGDMVWVYTELGASMTTAWLAKLSGADE